MDFSAPCPDCQPRAHAQALAELKQRRRQDKINYLYAGSHISPRFKTRTFGTFDTSGPGEAGKRAVLDKCRDFAFGFDKHRKTGTWLAMVGPCGTGKGHLAAAIANQIMSDLAGSVLYEKLIEMVSRIKAAWRGDLQGVTEERILEATRKCDLLILDEVGLQFDTQAERVILYRILDYRYEYLLPTILTTNLTLAQLEKVAGVRVVDRLHEQPNEILFFTWPSYRRRERQ